MTTGRINQVAMLAKRHTRLTPKQGHAHSLRQNTFPRLTEDRQWTILHRMLHQRTMPTDITRFAEARHAPRHETDTAQRAPTFSVSPLKQFTPWSNSAYDNSHHTEQAIRQLQRT